MDQDIRLFAGSASQKLTKKISKEINIPVGKCRVKHFADGELKVKIEENIRGRDVFIVQSTHPPAENILELLLFIDAAKRASADRITVVIPYFGYARQDRKDEPRVPISSKLIANLLASSGASRVLAMDLHAEQIQGFFDIPVDHLYAAPVFIEYYLKRNLKNYVIVSPDAGSVNRVRAFARRLKRELDHLSSLGLVSHSLTSDPQCTIVRLHYNEAALLLFARCQGYADSLQQFLLSITNP